MTGPWTITEHDHYTEIQCDFGKAIFAQKHLDQTAVENTFGDLEFFKLKQIHSDAVIPIHKEALEADGHYADKARVAPLVQTADCMPIVFLGPHHVFSVHAGWRGIEQNIIGKTSSVMQSLGTSPANFFVFIGPHIQRESFEVGKEVAARLVSSAATEHIPAETKVEHPHSDTSKAYIDLDVIALSQLVQGGFSVQNIHILKTDTVVDSRFHSYRRDKTPGRQWSFGYRV